MIYLFVSRKVRGLGEAVMRKTEFGRVKLASGGMLTKGRGWGRIELYFKKPLNGEIRTKELYVY